MASNATNAAHACPRSPLKEQPALASNALAAAHARPTSSFFKGQFASPAPDMSNRQLPSSLKNQSGSAATDGSLIMCNAGVDPRVDLGPIAPPASSASVKDTPNPCQGCRNRDMGRVHSSGSDPGVDRGHPCAHSNRRVDTKPRSGCCEPARAHISVGQGGPHGRICPKSLPPRRVTRAPESEWNNQQHNHSPTNPLTILHPILTSLTSTQYTFITKHLGELAIAGVCGGLT